MGNSYNDLVYVIGDLVYVISNNYNCYVKLYATEVMKFPCQLCLYGFSKTFFVIQRQLLSCFNPLQKKVYNQL